MKNVQTLKFIEPIKCIYNKKQHFHNVLSNPFGFISLSFTKHEVGLTKYFYIIIVFYHRSSVVYISTKEDDTNKIAKFPIITFVQISLHSSSMTFAKKELAEYGQKLTTYNLFFLKVQITRNSPVL